MKKAELEIRTATDDKMPDEQEAAYKSKWGIEPKLVKESLLKKERTKEDEAPSAARLLTKVRQKLFKMEERLGKGEWGAIRKEAAEWQPPPPSLRSRLAKSGTCTENLGKEEVALQVCQRQLKSATVR